MSFASFAASHPASYNSNLIANRPAYNGLRRPMTPENLANLKRMEASDRRSLKGQCSVHFVAGCDCGAATVERVSSVPVKPAKPARKAKPAAAPKVARTPKVSAPKVAKVAKPAKPEPKVAGPSFRTPTTGNPVTVRRVAPVKRGTVTVRRHVDFSSAPSLKDGDRSTATKTHVVFARKAA